MKTRPFKEYRSRHIVPLYGNKFYVYATTDMGKTVRQRPIDADNPDSYGNSTAIACMRKGRRHIVCFNLDFVITADSLAHEVYHVTQDILENIGYKQKPHNHEPAAYLMGWLMQHVMNDFRKWKIKVN